MYEKGEAYTIGHSNVEIDVLMKSLLLNKIQVLVDIRNRPYSKYCPQFNMPTVKAYCMHNKIEYIWKPSLGGFEKWNEKSFNDLEQTLSLTKNKKVCYMCSERNEKDCHRYTILQPEAENRGYRILHIDVKTGEVKKPEIKVTQILLLDRLTGRTSPFEGEDGGSSPCPAVNF